MTNEPLKNAQKAFKDRLLQRLEHEVEYRKDIAEHSSDPMTSHAPLIRGLRLAIGLIKRARFVKEDTHD
jgi:hypothetical protein